MNVAFSPCSKKKGSVIIVVVCSFAALLILLVSFMKSTTSRVYTTKKLGDSMLAREFANSLATLSSHYIKDVELKDKNSKLRKALSAPLSKMEKEASEDITSKLKKCIDSKVKAGSDSLLSKLEKESGLNNLKWELSWIVNKNDFQALKLGNKTPYPREKVGMIRIYMKVSYVLPGRKDTYTEDYMFVSQINIVANILPVLSKFTLYIEDALDGSDRERFNVVHTKANGDLKGAQKYRPWVLNHGTKSESSKNSYKDLATSNRGFVYLGGGTAEKPIALGIARGWDDDGSFGEFGEDFHFFKNTNKSAGYWKTEKVFGPNKGIMVSEIGLCDVSGSSDDNLLAWQEMFGDGLRKVSSVNSIFRLLGTDKKKSLSMVLGHVHSRCGAAKIYKNGDDTPVFLRNIIDENRYLNVFLAYDSEFVNADGYAELVSFSNAMGGNLSFDDYNSKYASQVVDRCYNNDYMYSINDNKVDYPVARGNVNDTTFKSLAGNHSNNRDFTQIPTGYDKIYDGVGDLTELSKFLDSKKLSIDGSEDSEDNKRLVFSTKVFKAGDNLESYLIDKGVFDKKSRSLNLNGWIYVKCDSSLDITIDKCNVVSHGGIIIGGGGNINIKGDITGKDGNHLTLVSLSGNVIVEKEVKNIDASLIAGGGQVKLMGDASAAKLTINGNIAMKKIKKGEEGLDKMARGIYLNYKDELSALPDKTDSGEDRSELPMLMFSYKDNPKMYD